MKLKTQHFHRYGLSIKAIFTVNDDGIKHGLYESRYENGQLEIRCTYKNGVQDGPCEEYLEDGRLLDRCVYKNGKPLFEKEAIVYLKEWEKDNHFSQMQQDFNHLIQQEKDKTKPQLCFVTKKIIGAFKRRFFKCIER